MTSIELQGEDHRFMQMALELGRRGLGTTWPNPAVGAVVVQHQQAALPVGRGWTQPGGRPHAETEALTRAGSAARGATLYVTLEPCSHHGKTAPCVDAIIAAGVSRVVSAIEDPNPEVAGQGHARMRAAHIAVEIGVGADEARHAHAGHFQRMRDGRPYVSLKLAVSADEKVGLDGRRPVLITGRLAQERVHRMRAMNDAVLTGIGTVMADDPQLTCRLPGMAARSPVRVVLDTHLRLPEVSKLASTTRDTPVWVLAAGEAPAARERALQNCGVQVLRVDSSGGRVDLTAALRLLGKRGITRLMVEGGPRLAASLAAADLVDELVLFRSRGVIGVHGLPALEDCPLSSLTKSSRLKPRAIEAIGEDSVEVFDRV
jgi:diaminohydroxyphosphoribosylaminopyrimidine deaminase / 5-amino-6-(5-phosphoribosylamino)uracil reductase